MRKAFFFCLCLVAAVSRGQDYVDLVKLQYGASPFNTFEGASQSNLISEPSLVLTAPIPLSENTALITGLFAGQISTQLVPTGERVSLYTINPRLGINHKFNLRWSGQLIFLPKLSSDLENITARDYQYGAVGIMKYKKSSNLSYKFGAYYNSEIFSPFLVPIFGLYYQSPDKKYEVNLSLPISGFANMRIHRKTRAGIEFNGIVRTFDIDQPGVPANTYVEKSSNEATAYLQFRLAKGLLLESHLGYSVARYYRVFKNEDKIDFGLSAFRFGDDRNPLNPELSDGLLLELRLLYRFYL